MLHKILRGGFAELNPDRTANELFHDLQPGDRVAITTRFNNNLTQEYVRAFEARNVTARVVLDQEAYQDFCFLKRAQRQLAAPAMSTFAIFAGMLANNRSLPVHKYAMRFKGWPKRYDINWTHPELRERMKFHLYDP